VRGMCKNIGLRAKTLQENIKVAHYWRSS